MKPAGLPLDVVAYTAPQELPAVNAAERRGQPWSILASTSTRGTVKSVSWLRAANWWSSASAPSPSASPPCSASGPGAHPHRGLDRQRMGGSVSRGPRPRGRHRGPELRAHVCHPHPQGQDRRDARALAEACLLGAYRPAHRLSDPQRHVRGRLESPHAPASSPRHGRARIQG
jgi:hypothetical protein